MLFFFFKKKNSAQGMCFGWSTPCGSRRSIWVLLILWCLFARAGRDSRAQWSEVPSVERRYILFRNDVYEHNNECRGLKVIVQDWSSEVVALSCHVAMDLLCQGMRDACQDSSLSQCSHVWEDSLTLEGLSQQGEGVW